MAEELGQEKTVEQAKSKKKGVIIAIVALVVVLAIAVFAYSVLPGMRARAPYELTPVEQADPSISKALTTCTIKDSEGAEATIGDIAKNSHKPIVMNLWATWCPHCTTEMEAYQKLFDEYGDKVDFVILDIIDRPGEELAARDYIKEHGFTFPVYYDIKSEVKDALFVTGIPMSVVMSADSDVLLVRSGEITYEAMKGTIDKLLKS